MRFLAACGRSYSFFHRSGLVRTRFGRAWGPSGELFRAFKPYFPRVLGTHRLAFRKCSGHAKTQAKSKKNLCFSYVSSTSRMSHTRQKPTQNRSRSLSNRASHKGRAKNPAWDIPGSVLEGSGTLLGASWPSLGRLWCALGRLLAPLGRLLNASWALLGVSWPV